MCERGAPSPQPWREVACERGSKTLTDRLWLMELPSLSRSPVDPSESTRSLPARSTRWISLLLVVLTPAAFWKTCEQRTCCEAPDQITYDSESSAKEDAEDDQDQEDQQEEEEEEEEDVHRRTQSCMSHVDDGPS